MRALLTLGALLAGCVTARVDLDAERAALLRLQAQEQTAHLTENPDLLVELFAEPLYNLDGGRITPVTRDAGRQHFQTYFDTVEFVEWADIDPPVVRISRDGTMAYVLVHKRVRLTYDDERGATQQEHTVFAWMEAWEKIDGTWTLMAVASTDHPGDAVADRDDE